MRLLSLSVILAIALSGNAAAQEKGTPAATPANAAKAEKLAFKTDWKGERINLPTQFAPDMKLKGVEEIRFAPGMFDAKSDSFFTYVFVFAVSGDQELTPDLIKSEILVYYRGLAKSVLQGRKEVDTSKFAFAMKPVEKASAVPGQVDASKVKQFTGKLDWVEPFRTAEQQQLHFEMQAWKSSETGRNYLFVCTSPAAIQADSKSPLWKEMREIRQSFTTHAE